MPVLFGRNYGPSEIAQNVGDSSQLFGVDLVTATDGRERGNRILRFRSGSGLSFDVMVDRAMDLAGLSFCGAPIGWHSPSGFRSPWLHENDAEDGFGWFRSMSGLMNTCGLDHIHAPERDSADHFNHPPRPSIQHSLHGRIAMTPATLTGYGTRWEGERCFLFASGSIRQATVFGENLELSRRIEIEVGTSTIRYEDQVRNLGFAPTPHAYLWHINMGWPLVAEGAEVVGLPSEPIWQMRADDEQDRGPFRQSPPLADTTQQVYQHGPELDEEGFAYVAMVNDHLTHGNDQGLALEIGYDAKAMPALFQWQNFKRGHNVVALEPCTTNAGSRKDWHERGEFKWLEHGDAASYQLALTPHLGFAAIERLRDRLSKAQPSS